MWPHMDLVLTQNLTMFGLRPHSDLSKYGLSLVPKLDHIWTQSWLVLKEAQTLNHLGGDSVVLMTAFLRRVHVVLFLDFSSCKLSCDPSGWMSSSKTSRLGTTGLHALLPGKVELPALDGSAQHWARTHSVRAHVCFPHNKHTLE